jgi:hypothetical protein
MLAVLLLVSNAQAVAQCAMCKTSVESDLNSGGSIGKELNHGILYLMAIPYVILMVGGYFFFKKPIDEKLKAWKEKRFPSKQTN